MIRITVAGAIVVLCTSLPISAQRLMEGLGRGLIALRTDSNEVFVQWRLVGTDPPDIAFNLYRVTGDGEVVRVNNEAISGPTHFVDRQADASQQNAWFVRPIVNGTEQTASARFTAPAERAALPYLSVPISAPDGYHPNDASVGDLDGAG